MTNVELKSKLEKSLEHVQGELSKIRTGRATPALLENIKVNAYGSMMSILELGSISVTDATNMAVSTWDKSLLDTVAKAIMDAGLNLNPVVDGDIIRVPLPDLTEERRIEMTKLVSTKIEDAKSSVRNIRQIAMKDIDKEFSDKIISEDAKFESREETEETVKEYTAKVIELGEAKKKDLLKV